MKISAPWLVVTNILGKSSSDFLIHQIDGVHMPKSTGLEGNLNIGGQLYTIAKVQLLFAEKLVIEVP